MVDADQKTKKRKRDMLKELAETIVSACEKEGFTAQLYIDYSGRGMYGDKTTGVVADSEGDLLCAIVNNSDMFDDHCSEYGQSDRSDFRVDSMGLGLIIY